MVSTNSQGQSLPQIMLFADWFEPGYKAGGPIRSCLNFAKQMQDNYNILVFTSDRDLNEQQPYQQIVTGEWIQFDKNIRVFYCPASQLSARFILEQIRKMKPDFIYLNSMYSKYFTIYPLLLRKGGFIRQPIVLSPRGMLKPSAVQFKKTKKKIFLSLMRLAGMQKLIHFHATDQAEQEDIRANFGNKVKITQAANFGGIVTDYPGAVTKTAKELSVVFVGRIHPVKNLDYLLDLLSAVEGRVSLTVIGSEEDKSYSIHCKQLVNKLPGNIQVHFTGEIPNNDLPEYMRQHHIFALPTRGENFGHAIFEALSAGKPVLISDQTPWRHLQMEKAGWDIDLKDKKQFLKALQQAIDLEQHQYNEWSKGAWQLAHQFSLQPGLKEKYFNLF